ncbi:unnamed protein product, partial [Amoebophrya sp. A25]|eukprot:GSA25T00021680001.1
MMLMSQPLVCAVNPKKTVRSSTTQEDEELRYAYGPYRCIAGRGF